MGMAEKDMTIHQGECDCMITYMVNGISMQVFIRSSKKLYHWKLELGLNLVNALIGLLFTALEPLRRLKDCNDF
jgi:hypothetical protein